MKKVKNKLNVCWLLLFFFSTYFIVNYNGNTLSFHSKVYAATVSKNVKVASISLNKTKNTLTLGGKDTLKATILPSSATNKKVVWTTSNSKVATVSNGVVTAVGKGTATITVTTSDGKKTSKYIVTVNPVVKVTSVKLNKTKNVLTIGKKDTLVSTVSPSNATNKGIIWSTSNSKVATVSNGVVTAIGKGTATIKATTVDGKKTASYSVTVNPVIQAAPAVKVTSVVLNKTFQELTLGEWDKLYAYEFLSSSNATYQPITWKTSNSKVATVSSKGEVTTVGPGTTVISATAGGKTAKCTITVKNPVAVKSIALNKTTSSISIGATDNLYANLLPANANGMSVVWKTSNSKVATVTSYGEVKAVGKGTAAITATTQDGSKSASCKVTVTSAVKVRSVALSKNIVNLTVGDYYDYLYATISPSIASNKDVTWRTSNSKIVTVEDGYYFGDGYKKIRAVGVGTATVTVTTADGSKISSCIVTVNAAIKAPSLSSITLNKTIDTLAVGTTDSLNATLNPYNTAYQTIGWTTSNPKVALVNSSGEITAVGVGKAVITATSDDGKKSASCRVTVTSAVKVKSVTLNKTTSTLNVGGYDWLSAIVSPNNATNQSVIWSTSNPNVATVSSGGYINAMGTGKATITATTEDGKKTATCVITVNPPVKVTSVSFYIPSATLNIGMTSWLNAQVYPVNAANKNLTWSTSNSKIATVDSSGYVTAVSAGKATITATTVDGNKRASCVVTVNPPVKVTGIGLYTTSTNLNVGDNSWLSYTVYPYNAANKNVTWASSNTKVATVDSNGYVKGISAGKATITVTTEDGKKTAVCNVTVSAPVKVSSISLNRTTDRIVVGNNNYLNSIIYPYNAVNQNVIWTTSNSKVATVSTGGNVTAVSTGTATITATTEDGSKTAKCIVTVIPTIKVTSVALNRTTDTLTVGGTDNLWTTIYPYNAANQSVIWTTSNSKVATVSSSGYVTATGAGTATITATTVDGSKTATCKVTVNTPIAVTSVALSKTTSTLSIGGTDYISATVSPRNAANQSVIWTTSNSSVVIITNTYSYGEVYIKGIAAGTATITATTADGSKIATCKVTVNAPVAVTSVGLSKTKDTLTVGGTDNLNYTIYPYNAANENVAWTSSNSNVAAVDSDGDVTAIAVGTAVITATTDDGRKTATCTVTVNPPVSVTSVGLDKAALTLSEGQSEYIYSKIYPNNAANKAIVWTTSDSKVASVSNYYGDGYVTAVGAGKATIKATTVDGSKVATCTVTVNPIIKVTSVALNKSTSTLSVGRTDYLYATVAPSDAADQSVIWTTSDSSVATVNYYGNVTAVGVGTATITATTEDGNKTATCVITVTN
ncbi:Ig-like domain-containing protein [Clostridium pasteurianum]|uniref:Ig-like domain-containing protein n=1 Tax=Clostridium pasteurianum TaxID=1501 RepID=UPI002260A1EC|nr:Ig-like domain-containing protein [Clostridium pasteurianum]UZW15011.1 Ig-like domain-containing protein [Clostridium pasteurianum]